MPGPVNLTNTLELLILHLCTVAKPSVSHNLNVNLASCNEIQVRLSLSSPLPRYFNRHVILLVGCQ